MRTFALAYADQTEQDHAALVKAVRSGRVEALAGGSPNHRGPGYSPCADRAGLRRVVPLLDTYGMSYMNNSGVT